MKDNVKWIRRQAADLEKIFAKDLCNKGLLSNIFIELLKLNNKKQLDWKRPEGQKAWRDTPLKKIHRWQVYEKVFNIIVSLGNCKFKQQWDTITHLLEWPKSKTLTPSNASEGVEQQELSLSDSGNAKCHFKRQFGRVLQN